MSETDKPSSKKRIAFLFLFIIGLGMFFVTTAGPLSGPAMSWGEAMAGLVPGAVLLVVGHLLHTRALAGAGESRKAALWWVATTVLLLGLGGALVYQGGEKRDQAERELDDARARQRAAFADPFAYRGYDDTGLLERDVEHYETAITVGWGTLGVSLLFAVGSAFALRGSRR